MDSQLDWYQAKALLDWYVEMGVVDAVGDVAIDRTALPDAAPWLARRRAAQAGGTPAPDSAPAAAEAPAPAVASGVDPLAEAQALAAGAASLEALAEAMAGFEHIELKRGARNFVFSDGNPGARVMIVGEAPGAEEDRIGRPFVGRAGQLLDRMFAAIGLARTSPDAAQALYITNVLPWRPPGNRTPTAEEMAMMVPFLTRHIELADPDVLVLMGNTPCGALIGRTGILRLRGHWTEAAGRPVMPMTHPAYLLRNPAAKREAWADLLDIQAKLRDDA
jgi:DNA polymerase